MPGLFSHSNPPAPRPRNRGIGPAERRRRELNQVRDSTAAESIIKGQVTVLGGGDLTVDVNFPVIFTEKPHFTFGGEIRGSVNAELGSYPMISVMVGNWIIQSPDATDTRNIGRKFYTGAQLLIAVTGSLDTIAHYRFEGTAITNPTGSVANLTTDNTI